MGRLCTQQALRSGTAWDGPVSIWARGFIRTTCLLRSTIPQTPLFPREEEEESFRLFPVDLHTTEAGFLLLIFSPVRA